MEVLQVEFVLFLHTLQLLFLFELSKLLVLLLHGFVLLALLPLNPLILKLLFRNLHLNLLKV